MTRLDQLASRWRRRLWLAGILRALACSWLAFVLVRVVTGSWTLTAVAAAAVFVIVAGSSYRVGRVADPRAIANHLDRTLPALEDSAELLLAAREPLSPLEKLQRERVEAEIERHPTSRLLPSWPLARPWLWWAGCLALSGVVWATVPRTGSTDDASQAAADAAAGDMKPQLRSVEVHIEPPAYTGLAARKSRDLSIEAEEGSRVTWQVRVRGPVRGARLVFADAPPLALERTSTNGFSVSREVREPHIYALHLDTDDGEIRSDLARLTLRADRAPEIRIAEPASRLDLAADDPARVRVVAEAVDDYGLSEARLVATLATGSGENVRFREVALELDGARPAGASQWDLTRVLDLPRLGMQPGGELYFHVEASDNREPDPNQSRTPAWRISLAGDTSPVVELAAGLPIIQPPESFRSQRQIIIDTERLIEDQPRITPEELEHRSRSLGFDQSALRMRYGGLLGEEFESGQPVEMAEDAGTEVGLADPEAEADPLEGFSHEHDTEESATFFDNEVRSRLRAMLREMWDAEGHLHTIRPDAALPHEYSALELLKSVQEAERIYVRKVGFEPPPLDPDGTRLSGDLSEIEDQSERRDTLAPEASPELRRALTTLSGLARGEAPPPELDRWLDAASDAATTRLLVTDDLELDFLQSLRTLAERFRARQPLDAEDIDRAIQGLWTLLPDAAPRPSRAERDRGRLIDAYRSRIEALP